MIKFNNNIRNCHNNNNSNDNDSQNSNSNNNKLPTRCAWVVAAGNGATSCSPAAESDQVPCIPEAGRPRQVITDYSYESYEIFNTICMTTMAIATNPYI